jgi:peptidoglycan/xylan/chitin deacetylase (PgdA/CDA1 family)/GT2 family glycosyltransferase
MVELSVIIPTFNRAGLLRACLEALARQTQPSIDFEVVVVVDGSSDNTREMLAQLPVPYSLRVHGQPNRGAATARNKGAALAAGWLFLFLDDDIVADPDLVAAHVRAHRERGRMLGLGHLTCQLLPGSDGFARQYAQWWNQHYVHLADGSTPLSFMDCWSGNMSVPRTSFYEAGGFATDLVRHDDIELGYRLERLGLPMVYLPEAIGHQDYRKGFRAIATESELAGVASLELYRRHPAVLKNLRMGRSAEARLRFRLARRLLLQVQPPMGALTLLSHIVGRGRRANSWYGLLFDYFYWRGVRRAVPDDGAWRRLTRGTPILLYHAFGRPGERPTRFVVPARRFAQQMAWIRRRGYRVLSLEELLRCRRENQLPPERSIVVTIDDGYGDVADVAHPILRRHGFPATLFLVTGAVGRENDWDRGGQLAGRGLLSWSTILSLMGDGLACGAHSRSHRRLTSVSLADATGEVLGSRLELEERVGQRVGAFAYPYGASDETCQTLAEQAGFDAACGIEPGGNSLGTPSYALHRTEIYGTDSLLRFALAVWLGDAFRGRGPRRSR